MTTFCHIRLAAILALAALSATATLRVDAATFGDLKVMTFNVWQGEQSQRGREKMVEIIQTANADILGLQEMGRPQGQEIADTLGYYYFSQSASDIQILSRFPIVGASRRGWGAEVEITPGHTVHVFNTHLAPYPYQPYDLRDGLLPSDEGAVIAAADRARGAYARSLVRDMEDSLASGSPVFLVGDFNEPSHLDWTEAAADATDRAFDLAVSYPTSHRFAEAGMVDSFRLVRPDEVHDRAYTWTPGYPPPSLAEIEVHDRIDIVYHHGSNVAVTDAWTVGLDLDNPNTDVAVTEYNSDHRAVVASFDIASLEETVLTFSGLAHEQIIDQGYGDRMLTSPNVTVEYTSAASPGWMSYAFEQTPGANSQLFSGVAALRYDDAGADFSLVLTPEEDYGVRLDRFDLVDFSNLDLNHTIDWELWENSPGGLLLANGTTVVPPQGASSVLPDVNVPFFGPVVLRLRPLDGDGRSLAVDNVAFVQLVIAEPSSMILLAVAIGMCLLTRQLRR